MIHLDMLKLHYYKGNYAKFKKMLVQKRAEQIKQYEKQEKKLKEMKSAGKSSKQAVRRPRAGTWTAYCMKSSHLIHRQKSLSHELQSE